MTKEEIIKELNVCDFKDKSVLSALDTMAKGALWMQEKMIDKACEWLKEVYLGDYAWDDCRNAPSHLDNKSLMEYFKKAMEE